MFYNSGSMMRFLMWLGCVGMAAAATQPSSLWMELKAKREGLAAVHQEFELTQTFKTGHGNQSVKRQIILDLSGEKWRERTVSGSANQVRIFDGKDLLRMEESDDEYVRTRRQSKDEDAAPAPYAANGGDFAKAREIERTHCGLQGKDHQCVVLEVPLMRRTRRASGRDLGTWLRGSKRMMIDTETGLLLASRSAEITEDQVGGYQVISTCMMKQQNYGAAADASLFQLPSSDMHEVKELSKWNAARIKKELVGKNAPDLAVTDIQGKAVMLSAFKGKTVLLDFWTTWCPPCRADARALHSLYRKYGDNDLMIISISVSEDRDVVKTFLNEHPVDYPVVLTTENDMPRPYQIGVFPTYIIVEKDGTVAAAIEGDKGFTELRKLLKRAGLDTE